MALAIPAAVPATFRWLYYAAHYGYLPDQCAFTMGPQQNAMQGNESQFNRAFYWCDSLGGAAGGAPFNPTCRDWNNVLTTQDTPVDATRWNDEVLSVLNGSNSDVNRPTLVQPNILGTRSSDPTWPGGAALAAWTPGGPNSPGDRSQYVEDCVLRWANLMLTVPYAIPYRLWHEMGNADVTYGDTVMKANGWAVFKSSWRKVVDYLRVLGVCVDDATGKPNLMATKALIAWCPASHPANPSSDVDKFPHTNYPTVKDGTKWVHLIERDIYMPTENCHDSGQQWVDEFRPLIGDGVPSGPSNTAGRPLISGEGGSDTTQSNNLAVTTELLDRLEGIHAESWRCISGYLWWNATSQSVPTTGPLDTLLQTRLNTPYYIPDGLAAEPGGVVVVAPGLVHLEGWDHHGVDANAVRGGGGATTQLLNRRLIDAHNPGALGWDATQVHHAHTDSTSMFCQNPGVAANWQFLLSGASQAVVGHLAFRFHVLPNVDNYLVRCIDTAATGVGHDLQVRTTGQMRLATGGVNSASTPEVISLNTWYILEWLAEAVGTSHSVTWMVYPAGLSASPLIAERTDTATGQTDQRWAECRVGLGAATVTAVEWNLDDWLLSETDTEYPLGESYVKLYKPTGKGTHVDGGHFTNFAGAAVTNASPQNSHLDVDDVPSATTTGVQQTSVGATSYLEYTMSSVSEGVAPRAVRVLGSFFPAATTTNSADLRLHEGGTDSPAMTYDASAVAAAQEWHASLFPTKPSGGAWTAAALQGTTVRFGYATNTATPPKLADVYLQAAFLASTDITVVGGSVTLNTQAFGGTVATTGSVDVTGGSVAPLMRAFGGTAVRGGGSVSVSAPSLDAVDAGTLEVLIGVAEGVNQFTPGTGFIEKADIVQNLATTANDQTLFIAYKVVPAGPTNTATGALDTSASWATMHLLITPTPITLSVFTPAADESVGANPGDVYDVSGTATSGGGTPNVTVNGISVPLDASGNFTYPLALVAGANPVSVVAQEPAGAQRMVSVFRVVTVTVPDTGGGGGPSDPVELSDDMLRIQKIIRESGLDPK